MVPRVPNIPPEPSARQIAEHELTGHAVCRSWCRHCVASKGRAHAHSSREEGEVPEIGIDYGFFGRGGEDVLPILCVKCRNSSTGCLGATVVDRKGASGSFLTAFIMSLGFKRILVRSDNERSLLSLIERVMNNLTGVELMHMTSPEGDHGFAEVGVCEIKAQTRILRSQLEQRHVNRIDEKDPLMSWIPRHAANCVSIYKLMDDGRTPDQRRCGKTWKRPGVYVGHHERSGAAIFLTPDGVKRGTRIARMLEHERWDRVFSATCVGVPWQLRPDQRNLARPVVLEAEADQGVALVIVMPAIPKTDRRRYVTKRDLVKYGHTDEWQACAQLASGMHNAKVPRDDRCRDRIGELVAEDDDQTQVERVSGTVHPEVEIPRPEAGEEMDVGEPTVVEDQQPVQQPVPTVRVGGSSSSGTRAGVGSRAHETNTDDRGTKRVRFTESRGQKRQGEDVEELAAKAEEQHLDADVEVPAHKTWRVQDVVGDAADAPPEQMNSFVQSKTEAFEKIEESLRPLCMAEDLNDDEIMELCVLSNELNAFEITATLNPSKLASFATRLGLREGFAADLTTARANGTMWEFSFEDDRAELRGVQNREHPELVAGSPPNDDFNSLLNTCAESQEISKLKTERIEPQIRTCVQAYKLQMAVQKHFVHEHPKDSASWDMLEVQPLVSDPSVHSIDGPMCRWSLKTGGSKDKTEKTKQSSRKSEQDGSRVPRKLLKYFVEMADGNATGDTST